LGSLRAAVAYPSAANRFPHTLICAALSRVGLAALTCRLDEKERWDKILTLGEQQRLALARLLLHAPRWIFLEDLTGAMDGEVCQLMLSILDDELADSAVIGFGSAPAFKGFYQRIFRLLPVNIAVASEAGTTQPFLPSLQAAE
jgi:putative ATP-binding cassette transporter